MKKPPQAKDAALDAVARDNYARKFADHGVDPARIEFQPALPQAVVLNNYLLSLEWVRGRGAGSPRPGVKGGRSPAIGENRACE